LQKTGQETFQDRGKNSRRRFLQTVAMNNRQINLKPQAAPPLVAGGLLQRKCACGQHTIAGAECQECGKQRLQRSALSSPEPFVAPSIINEVLRSPGHQLDPHTRATMGERLGAVSPVHSAGEAERQAERAANTPAVPAHKDSGYDFAHVRVTYDQRAAESARAVNAKAYTVGHDIVFGNGYYSPATASGQDLIAHELTHVVQQAQTGPRLSRAPLDLKKVDLELFWGLPLTQDRGEIGFGATKASPDGDSKYPIEAVVFPRKHDRSDAAFQTVAGRAGRENNSASDEQAGAEAEPKPETKPEAKPEERNVRKIARRNLNGGSRRPGCWRRPAARSSSLLFTAMNEALWTLSINFRRS
jgi:hypothetical protein